MFLLSKLIFRWKKSGRVQMRSGDLLAYLFNSKVCLVLFCLNLAWKAHFSDIQLKRVEQTGVGIDGWTNRRIDTLSRFGFSKI